MGDWSKPILTDSYANFLNFLNARLVDCARMFDPGQAPSSLPTGTIRFNPATHRFEKWSGSAWSALDASDWDMSVARLGGKTAAEFLPLTGGAVSGTLGFGSRLGQFLNLYGTTFGLGIQTNTAYLRTAKRFAVHVGGTHSDAEADPGAGGVCLLDAANGLWKFYVGSTGSALANVYFEKRNTWGNNYHPVIRGENADEYIMLHMPHLPYLDSGTSGVSSSKQSANCGALVRMAANPSASHYWDAGIVKNAGQDIYSICRDSVPLLKVSSAGNFQSTGPITSNLLAKSQFIADTTGGTGATYNTIFGSDGSLSLTNNCYFDGAWKCAGRGSAPGTCSYLKIMPDGSANIGNATGQAAGATVSPWNAKPLWDANGNWTGGLSEASGYTAKAWVNFNGTETVAIRSAKNITSITDNGTGDYSVNFSSPMADSSYSVNTSNKLAVSMPLIVSQFANSVRVSCRGTGAQYYDDDIYCVTIFG